MLYLFISKFKTRFEKKSLKKNISLKISNKEKVLFNILG